MRRRAALTDGTLLTLLFELAARTRGHSAGGSSAQLAALSRQALAALVNLEGDVFPSRE
eukprot:SAG11_NODE_22662_length_402_cov_1.006601_1_plen_58_part_01